MYGPSSKDGVWYGGMYGRRGTYKGRLERHIYTREVYQGGYRASLASPGWV